MTEIIQPMLAVLLVLGLLAGMLWLLRRRGMASFSGVAAPRQMKVVERIPLSAQHALHLVRVGDKLILVTTAPGSCQMMESPVQGISTS